MPIHNSNEDSMNGSERTLPEETYKSPAGVKKRKMPPPLHRDSNEEADNRLLGRGLEIPYLGEDEANNEPTLRVLPEEFSFFFHKKPLSPKDVAEKAIEPAAKRQK